MHFFPTERLDVLSNFCPNIETFRLFLHGSNEIDDNIIEEVPAGASLSTIGFKNLISLSLYGQFQLHDGAFLITVNQTSLIYFVKINPCIKKITSFHFIAYNREPQVARPSLDRHF